MNSKENYLRMLSGEIPEFVPSYFDPWGAPVGEELLTPVSAPNGPVVTSIGVEYIGSPDNNWGAMPTPGKIVVSDITKWRDQLKIKDVSDWDWESYYTKKLEKIDRSKFTVSAGGGDYFLTLVSLMGFDGAFLAMYEEPDEVIAMLEHISEFYTLILKKQMQYLKPDLCSIMDDDSGYRAPFFSVEMYQKFFKPFHKKHADIGMENGCYITRHDCGKSEQFIDDWLDIGIRAWGPAQITNDWKGIKKKYGNRLSLEGCWDNQGKFSTPLVSDQELKDALADYVDTLAPGGGFVFSARIAGEPEDPVAIEKRAIIKNFYEDYVRNYYKTHS